MSVKCINFEWIITLSEMSGNLKKNDVTKATLNLTIFMIFLSKGILKRKMYWIFWNFSQYYEAQLNFHEMYPQIFRDIGPSLDSECCYTVRNFRKFTKFLCYEINVKFDDFYDVFGLKYLKIAKNVTEI